MRVCFFGIHDPLYARNRVLKEGFEKNGYEVVECRVDALAHRGLAKYFRLYDEYRRIKHNEFEYVLVCFPGQAVALFARALFGRRIILDAFLSLYDSGVWDRKVYARWSVRALYSWLLDWVSCRAAWRILLDTNAHIQYFRETFGVPVEKCIRVWIGADNSIFYPRDAQEGKTFTVHFHGTFIPLQGLKYVVEAANILRDEDIRFRIVGSGQEFSSIQKMVRDLKLERAVEFVGKVPLKEVPNYLAHAHISLGIFGDTSKTLRVIPNKVYESIAMSKCVITADTPAIRELFQDRKTAVLVPTADPKALASAILEMKADPVTRTRIARNGKSLFCDQILPESLVRILLMDLRDV